MTPIPAVVDLPFVRVDLERRLVQRPDGSRDRLTAIEVGLLRYLLERQQQIVSRDQLLTDVWGYSPTTHSRSCDTAIRRLRQKIELDPSSPECLLTVHGGGYTLSIPSDSPPELPPRAAPGAPARRVVLGSRTVDFGRAQIDGPDGPMPLTAREIDVLEALVTANGATIDRNSLQRQVWGSAGGRAVESTVSRLRRKLEVDPAVPRFLLTTAGGYRLAVSDPCPAPPRSPLPTALPSEVDARFGRDVEIDTIVARFASKDRLVTLTGPGGAGKSRLALAAAWRMAADRPAFWVDLQEARTVERMTASVALALRLQLGTVDAVAEVADAARAFGPVLLVLDNLEQLVPHAVRVLSTWLEQAPELWLLVTSRVPLGVRGERRLAVGPLALEAAVALFVDRAPCPPDPDDPELRALVGELGGSPLALELAASRTTVLGVRELRARLAGQLHLLTVADPSRPARHRSLRACLDASYDLLSPVGKLGFAGLAVFAGRFDLDAAEGVLALDDHPVVDVIQELVEASLLTMDADAGWFGVATHVQEYAVERLGSERAEVEARHRRTYAALGQPAALAALDGPQEAEARQVLIRQFDNLVRVVEGALTAGDGPSAVFAASAAWEVLALSGPYQLAIEWLEPLLELSTDDELRARTLVLVGRVRRAAGLLVVAEEVLTEAVRIAASLGSAEIGAQAHLELAALRIASGRSGPAESDAEVALGLARVLGNPILLCRAMEVTGRNLVVQHRIRDAEALLGVALGIARSHGARRREAEIQRWYAMALDRLGRASAKGELQRAAQIALDLGDRRLEAEILLAMEHLAAAQGTGWGSRALDEALQLFEAVGDHNGLADALQVRASVYNNTGQRARGAALLDRAEALSGSIGPAATRAKTMVRRAFIERSLGNLDEAERLLDEVIACSDRSDRREARRQKGHIALSRGDTAGARRIWLAEAEAAETGGDRFHLGLVENLLGSAAYAGRDFDAALVHWSRSAEVGWAHGFTSVAVMATGNAANLLAEMGRAAEADARMRAVLELDLSDAPMMALIRAVFLAANDVTLGRDGTTWLAEADRLADLHFDGLAYRAERNQVRAQIAERAARCN